MAAQRILIVEDDPDTQQMLGMILSSEGYEVLPASNGTLALEMLRKMGPDLVVLDWMMPRMNGLEVCRALREDPDTGLAATPVLLLTAKAQEPDLERGFAAGATDFVAKPFSTGELVSRVTAALPPGSVRR